MQTISSLSVPNKVMPQPTQETYSLKYRGVSHQSFASDIKSMKWNRSLSYRGIPYHFRLTQLVLNKSSFPSLRYRGIEYQPA